MYRMGGGPWRIGIGLKCMFNAQFSRPAHWKKIRSITFIVWVLGRVEKKYKQKNVKIFFLV